MMEHAQKHHSESQKPIAIKGEPAPYVFSPLLALWPFTYEEMGLGWTTNTLAQSLNKPFLVLH